MGGEKYINQVILRPIMRFAPEFLTGQILSTFGAANLINQYYHLFNQDYLRSGVEGGVGLLFLIGAYAAERGMDKVRIRNPLILQEHEPGELERAIAPHTVD